MIFPIARHQYHSFTHIKGCESLSEVCMCSQNRLPTSKFVSTSLLLPFHYPYSPHLAIRRSGCRLWLVFFLNCNNSCWVVCSVIQTSDSLETAFFQPVREVKSAVDGVFEPTRAYSGTHCSDLLHTESRAKDTDRRPLTLPIFLLSSIISNPNFSFFMR